MYVDWSDGLFVHQSLGKLCLPVLGFLSNEDVEEKKIEGKIGVIILRMFCNEGTVTNDAWLSELF